MKRNTMGKRMTAAALALVLLLALAACGQSESEQETVGSNSSADTLKGIYEALIAPESDYSQNKAMMAEYYTELEYGEMLGSDRITITFKANGNEYFTDGSWDFVQDGDRLTAVIADGDYTGIMNVMYMAGAIGSCFGMEPALVSGYLNGLGALGAESDNFSMTVDEAAGTTTYSLNIAGPWDMKELDQMVLTEAILGAEPLDENYTSQGGSVGKLQYLANGNISSYTVLFAEYGDKYLKAVFETLTMTGMCFVIAMVLSVLVTVMRVSPIKPLRLVGDLYVQIFRNIPGVALLIVVAYALPYLKLTLPWKTCVEVAVVLLASAFGSENFMTGINAIGVGQIEAARSIGLTFTQTMSKIVIPQALRSAVLPMTNLLIATMLTTALGSQVPMSPNELTGLVSYITTRETAIGILPFTVSAVIYAGVSVLLGLAGNALDKKVRIHR